MTSSSAALDDVVTFDLDLTLKIFVNDGHESFSLREVRPPANHPNFRGAQPPYVLADFGNGRMGLAAPVVRDENFGLAFLQQNDAGELSVATGEVRLLPIRGARISAAGATQFSQSSPTTFRRVDMQVVQGMAAQFRSAMHGNNKPDLGFIITAVEDSFTLGMCPDDFKPLPAAQPLPRPKICPLPLSNEECPPTLRPCFDSECCFCQTNSHPRGRCPNSCTTPLGPAIPFRAFCKLTQPFGPALTVYGNTCGD
jgi:hypothetical protein